jgi:hypothetical protein
MHKRIRVLGACVFALWGVTGITTIGCGDDSNGGGAQPDAGSDVSVTPTPTPPPPPGDDASANAADLTVYTGTTANLDASGSSASTFAWTVTSVPAGSSVTTATLQGAATAKPSFVADVSGDYVLSLAATNGTATSTKSVTVKAVPAPLFFMLTNLGDNPPYYEVRTVGTDGTGAHAVNCRQQISADAGDSGSSDTAGFLFLSFVQADLGVDWWEAPAGQPSRAAFQDFRIDADGGVAFNLAVGTNESTCQNPPKIVHALSNLLPDGGQPPANNKPGIYQPRFSPDGSRVAYIEQRPEGYYIATVGYDGNDYRVISTLCPSGGSDCSNGGDVLLPPRPQWIDNQTVAWARNISGADAGAGWEIMTATDGPLPGTSRYMSCDGLLPLGFAMLKDGSVLSNSHAKSAPADLRIVKPTSTGGMCTEVRNLTNLGDARAYARDFSVSPDGKKVAFVRNVPAADAGDAGLVTLGGEVYAAPIDGTSAPAPLTTPVQSVFFGPRYVAQGAYVSFNGTAPLPDGAVDDAGLVEAGVFDAGLPAIVIVPAGGGAVSYAATSSVGAKTFVIGGGNGGGCGFGSCAIASPTANLTGGLSALAVAALLMVRRRRRD